jgi:mpaB/rubber oxygenase-like protein
VEAGLIAAVERLTAAGTPFSEISIAGEFSTIPLAAIQDAGLHYSQADRDDIQHLWRYIGHLLGVPHDLLAVNEEQAHAIIAVKDLTDTPADADSRALVRALIENGTPPELLVPGPFVRLAGKAIPLVLHGLTRHWAGDEVADELEIPDTALKYLVPLLRPAVRATDLLRRVGLRDDARIATRMRARAQTLLDVGHAPAGVVTAAEAGATV